MDVDEIKQGIGELRMVKLKAEKVMGMMVEVCRDMADAIEKIEYEVENAE